MKTEAMFYEKIGNGAVHCFLCAHNCRIAESGFGFCGVRRNEGGTLQSLVYGELIAANVDPIEKKPFFHFLPNTAAYSIATVGCNFRCGFCQNWQISQVTKKDATQQEYAPAEKVAEDAKKSGSMSIAYTYSEPTIFFEYAYDVAREAKKIGLHNVFVTNGYMTKEPLEKIAPYLDAANVDLKSFSGEFYAKTCQARLEPVLDTIRLMKEKGIWVEVTTLLIPGKNDSPGELAQMAEFIASVGKETPWHLSGFHPDYKFMGHEATPIGTMRMAQKIGKDHGLRYVYLGNVSEGVDTLCYLCGELLVKRSAAGVEAVERIEDNQCPACWANIEGVWL